MSQIPKTDLKTGHYYIGIGRFSGHPEVALWDGIMFVGLSMSWGRYEANTAEYGDRGFSPEQLVLRII